jgi:DNA-binding transcriptional LysR family regulator
MGIYAIFPGSRHLPHRVRALVDYLAMRIGPLPAWDEILSAG